MTQYREFYGGYTRLYSTEGLEAADPKSRIQTIQNCLHELKFKNGDENKICVYCFRGYVWNGNRCQYGPDAGVQNCYQVQPINLNRCQKCKGDKGAVRGLATPNCAVGNTCDPPLYNQFTEERCDYCDDEKAENRCRCTTFQNSVQSDYGGKTINNCECKISNCESKVFLLFF